MTRRAPAPAPDPVDIETMRATVDQVLDTGITISETPAYLDLLRGQLGLMIPEVEAVTARQAETATPRYCALGCLGEARIRLNLDTHLGMTGPEVQVRKLAIVLNALCDHYEQFGGHLR